ncbi:WW domain binding protein 1-like [Acropora millepora]|uniref:WW domain binding protein 1-like n=1 Tax=Acropora millepora TaxID=45264 RepID=UPI001CF2E065|nr:WW domain binding protein 1-like [Acropora millepora]
MHCVKLRVLWVLIATVLYFGQIEAREYCGKNEGKDVFCDEGLCCGEFECCHYSDKYYKMWWFWMVWGSISLLGCCCAYHRKHYFATHWQIRNFVYLTTTSDASQPRNTRGELENDPKYNLPSYADVEAMGSLDPPADGEGAPPPYVDPLANEELEDNISQDSVSLRQSNEDVTISLIAQGTED